MKNAHIPAKTGILLVNLGTPEAPTPKAVRKYLAQFLHDRRVIDITRWLWCPILHGPVLTFRPKKVAKAYASVWNWIDNESPLLTITRKQAEGVQEILTKKHSNHEYIVEFAMRYGQPSIAKQLTKLQKAGCKKIKILPLYPQYAGATSGTVADDVARWILQNKWVPALEILGSYHDHASYIQTLLESTKTQLKAAKYKPDVLIASFHGLPVRYCKNGDPYYCHCHKTARLLAAKLGYDFVADWKKDGFPLPNKPTLLLTFQSRFGPEKWLGPATDDTIEMLGERNATQAQKGKKTTKIALTMPGFAADCLETLEEIAIEGKEQFKHKGGDAADYVTLGCLNDEAGHVQLLAELTKNG